ncbi:MAG: hypothetical protein ACLS6O_00035 [Bifidobacterium sp.]
MPADAVADSTPRHTSAAGDKADVSEGDPVALTLARTHPASSRPP